MINLLQGSILSYGGALVSFFFGIFLARSLTEDQRGLLASLLFTAGYFATIASLGLESLFRNNFSSIFRTISVGSIALMIFLLLLFVFTQIVDIYFLILIAAINAQVLLQGTQYGVLICGSKLLYDAQRFLFPLLYSLLGILFLYSFPHGIAYQFVVLGLAFISSCVVILVLNKLFISEFFSKSILVASLKASFGTGLILSLTPVNQGINKGLGLFLITLPFESEKIAKIAVTFSLVSFFLVPLTVFSKHVFSDSVVGQRLTLSCVKRFLILLSAVTLTLVCSVSSFYLVPLFYGPKYNIDFYSAFLVSSYFVFNSFSSVFDEFWKKSGAFAELRFNFFVNILISLILFLLCAVLPDFTIEILSILFLLKFSIFLSRKS